MSGGIDRLVAALDIEELDRDLFRAENLRDIAGYPLFGGQVAAQAVVAAARTVPADRSVHSLHGYFLRSGKASQPVILQVDRDRDGSSFSARRVAAVQNGEVIFNLAVSFQVTEEGAIWPTEPSVAFVDPSPLPRARARDVGPEQLEMFDIRVEQSYLDRTPGYQGYVPHRLWVRTAGALPDDPLVHLAVATYVSDLGSAFSLLEKPGGPSLDHAVWFHHPLRLDEWVLLDHVPLAMAGARGLYRGEMIDPTGRVCANLVQEHLSRPHRAPQA